MADKKLFKKLSKMPVRKRIRAVSSSPEIAGALAALSPTEFAMLFPKYYERGLPDVSGFRAATTAAAQKKQSEAASGILDRITSLEQRGEQYASDIYHKVKRKLGLEETPLPDLTQDQAAAWEKIKSGNVPTNSQDAKIFSGLSDSQLSSIGLTKTKDNTGKEVFQYTQPTIGREEAESRLRTGGTGSNKFFDAIIRAEGTGKHGDPYNTSLGYMKSPKPLTDMTMKEALEWGDSIRKAQGLNSSAKGAFQIVNTTQRDAMKALGIGMDEKFSPENQRRMAAWIVQRQGLGAWEGFKVHPEERRVATGAMQEGLHKQFTSAVKPEGPNGQYSDEQITKMMDQLRAEKNDARKQQLANILTNAGVPTATVNSLSDVKSSGVVGAHFGESRQCVALSKHFAPSIGPASSWTFHDGTSGIVPGAVIATTSYKDGSGGHMARQMPDGKSHYHTGVALTRPDAEGNVLIFDQHAGRGSAITKVNIYNYNGEKWGAVKGGEPSEHTMSAVNMALEKASDSEKSVINESLRGATPQTKASTPEIKPNVDAGTQHPVTPVTQEGKPAAPTAGVKGPAAPSQPAQPVPTAVVKPAGPQPVKYKFDEAAFEAAVRAKYGMLSSMYDRAGLVSEFKSKLPEGVSYNKGVLTINDPNSPHIKTIRQDMEKEFGKETIDKMITQVKAAPPPPPPEKKVEAAPPPEKHAEVRTSPGEAQQPPPSAAPATKVSDMPTPVPTAATGGSFNVPEGGIQAYPIGGLKNDNTVVVNKEQKPLFTMNSNEAATYNPSQGRVDVTPTTKPDGNAFGPPQDNVRNEIQQLKQEMSSSFMDAGARTQMPQMRQIPSTQSDASAYVSPSPQLGRTWQNAAMERAMNRTRMFESGDTLNNHFSSNNTNG